MSALARIIIWVYITQAAIGLIGGAVLGVFYRDEVVTAVYCVGTHADKLPAIWECISHAII